MDNDENNNGDDGEGYGATDNNGCLDDQRLGYCLPSDSTERHCKKALQLHQNLGVI